ncbi:MAG: hypothetical protein IJO00_01570 [Clostridia bacterium]|nr:hypothetical protein [Clostridia bacterium]
MIIESLKKDKAFRINFITLLSSVINGMYALGNLVLGIMSGSYWFITSGAYFLALCVMRAGCISALRSKNEKKLRVGRLVGLLLIFLCIVLVGSIILSDRLDVVKPMHKILMIAIAAFTTAKTTVAIVNIVKVQKTGNPIWIAIRNISCADAAGSILTMQRTMLISFGENMEISRIKLMNLLTGIGVCLIVLFLGVRLLRKNKNK